MLLMRRNAMAKVSNRRNFIKGLTGAAVAAQALGNASAAQPSSARSAEQQVGNDSPATAPKVYLETFEYENVRLLDSPLKKQVDETRQFYFNMPNDDILIGFRRRAGLPAPGSEYAGWYGGEADVPDKFKDWWMRGDTFNTFGQWLSGMARLGKATHDQALLDKAGFLMTEWAKTIEPNGYFYYSKHPITEHYIYEKTVQGLVDLYAYGGRQDALPHLEKITDFAIANLDRSRKPCAPTAADWASQGVEWYTIPENVYRAYQLTGNRKYRDFADVWRYTTYWDKFNASPNPDIHGLHAYSHCNTLSSAAMAYAVHGDSHYLSTIVNAYDYFERTQFYATGGYGPAEQLQADDGSLGRSLEAESATFETPCGSWAGFKLTRYLMRFTGEAKYGDWSEKLVYNGIGAALPMSGRGDTFYYSDYRLGGGRKVFHGSKFPCCSGTYIQAVADYHNLIYFKGAGSLYVNLFVPSEVTWNHEGAEVKIEQQTQFPDADTTVLTVRPSRAAAFDLKFRVPRWTRDVTVQVNGVSQSIAAHPGSWAVISRTWNAGDRVSIRLPMPLALAPIDRQHPNRVAVTYGPVVLVRDDRPILPLDRSDIASGFSPEGGLEFRLNRQPAARMVPFYQMGYQQPYTMYFDWKS
jgi:hypothetical protein